ncbi:MAG: hypothetical protein WC314_08485 [Vulcanimicrobiota bacterium]
MSNDLIACLDGFRQAGQLDSSGEFSLSREHAQKKLREFSLPEARLYVLNLVAGAVTGKATFVKFEADVDELEMTTDATLEDLHELEELEGILFSSDSSPVLRELVFGLRGLLPLKPSRVELEVTGPQGRARVEWDGSRYLYQNLDEAPLKPGLKLYVKERIGTRTVRKMAARIGGAMLPDSEEDAIFRYCNRCPISVTFNGHPANRPVILGQVPRFIFASDRSCIPPILTEFGTPRPAKKGLAGLLAVGGRLAPWVTLVYQGINFRLPEDAFPIPHLRGIVYCDELKKDLSQVQLVQDAAFQQLLQDIQSMAEQHFKPSIP